MAKYFSEKEFACKCCGKININPLLIEKLDKLRSIYGNPIYVSCGYRCPDHNREVGGVENSQHTLGNAADIYVDGNYEEFFRLVLDSCLFNGVGYYPNELFVHVDIRGGKPNEYRW